MISNFAILCKVHFSFKKWRKSILKTDSANGFARERQSALQVRRCARPRRHAAVRAVPASGAHAEALERPPVAAQRRRELSRDVRGEWVVAGGANPPDRCTPAARHWPPGRRTSPATPWPFHACLCHRRDLTTSQPTFPDYK
jgi:hypothetical protein